MAISPSLRFGVAIPQRFPGEIDVGLLPPFFAAIEELGYDSCWVVEQAINAQNDLAPIPLLSYAAALTSRARLGSSVLISVLRNPINLAKSLATLDRLSNGRLIVGVGMGNATGAPFSEAFGAPAKGKAARFEEGLLLMRRLWTGERVSFDGRFWRLDDSFISPTPRAAAASALVRRSRPRRARPRRTARRRVDGRGRHVDGPTAGGNCRPARTPRRARTRPGGFHDVEARVRGS